MSNKFDNFSDWRNFDGVSVRHFKLGKDVNSKSADFNFFLFLSKMRQNI